MVVCMVLVYMSNFLLISKERASEFLMFLPLSGRVCVCVVEVFSLSLSLCLIHTISIIDEEFIDEVCSRMIRWYLETI